MADLLARVEALEGGSGGTGAALEVNNASSLSDPQTTENVSISVTGISQVPTIDYIVERYPETEGNEFLIVSVEFINNSSETEAVNLYTNRAFSYVDDYSVQYEDLYSSLSSDLPSGKRATGYLVFEVPADWQVFEFCWRQGYDTPEDNTAIFTITPADVEYEELESMTE